MNNTIHLVGNSGKAGSEPVIVLLRCDTAVFYIIVTYDMAFAEPVVVPCEECSGHRYNPTALSYCYKGVNIEDVMRLTIGEAIDFFDNAKIRKLLQSIIDVGLNYLTLGQPTSTLSGGEVQRVKLASELHSIDVTG